MSNASCSSVFPNIIGGVMRLDHRMAALLAGSLSLAGMVATAQFLDAAELTQQAQPPDLSQPGPETVGSAPAELPSLRARKRVPGQPAENAANRPATVALDRQEAQGVLGREVRSAADENMGRIIDVIVDRMGNVRAAVIDFGGFLGVGSRKIAVDWNALHFTAVDGNGRITVEFTRDQVKAAPEYQGGKAVIVLSAMGGSDRFRVSTSVNSEK
jgi:PRC-barrel domain